MTRSGLRIIGGRARGRRLQVPSQVRPTEGRIREALFSIWQERIPGSRFLDLFAGSGAVGLEAASRGAAQVVCVEHGTAALRSLRRNLQELGEGKIQVVAATLPQVLPRLAREGLGPFDLIFADPPYRYRTYEALLTGLPPLLDPEGEAAVEHSLRSSLPERPGELVRVDMRRYGESGLSFYRLLVKD